MKLAEKLNMRYKWGWRIYVKKDLRIPPIQLAELHKDLVIEEDEDGPLVYIRDKKLWEK